MAKVFETRDYQERIHAKSTKYLQTEKNGIAHTLLIESPTGSGKTVMAMRIAKFLEEEMGHEIGWIAHRRELLNQALATNDEFFQVKNINPISMFTRTPEDYKHCTAVVVDECQHDASASCAILHQVIRPKIIIGLTATPYRTDRAQLSFQKVIKDAGIRQLIREGYLAQFKQWIIDDEWSPENVARTYVTDADKWGKSVIYFLTIKDAHSCNELLRQNGVRSALITGSSPRDEILRDFSNGAYDVLVNVAVLTEGFDEPTLKTVFVRPGSKGPTVQMAGRALRKHPSTPTVNVVQNNTTKYPFTRHACAINQYMKTDGKWRSIDPRNLNGLFRSQVRKLSQINTTLPEFLRKQRSIPNALGEQ